MKQYIELIEHVLRNGTRKENRTGIDTISCFNYNYKVDLKQGFPLLTTKEISWKNIVIELLWFLSGNTNIHFLQRHGCRFWDPWAGSKSGEVPSAYGSFWRRFPTHGIIDSTFMSRDGDVCCDTNYQIKWCLNELIRNPMSRRPVVSAWAPGNAQYSKLPPCHLLFGFNVQNNRDDSKQLNLHLTQRSADCFLGVPYNIASYSLLLALFSRFSGIEVGTFAHSIMDAHIYTCKEDGSQGEYDHIPALMKQIVREPRLLPNLIISDDIKTLEDVERLLHPSLTTEDIMKHFLLEGYGPWPAIYGKVAV